MELVWIDFVKVMVSGGMIVTYNHGERRLEEFRGSIRR